MTSDPAFWVFFALAVIAGCTVLAVYGYVLWYLEFGEPPTSTPVDNSEDASGLVLMYGVAHTQPGDNGHWNVFYATEKRDDAESTLNYWRYREPQHKFALMRRLAQKWQECKE